MEQLNKFRQKYSGAFYSYVRIANMAQAYRDFLDNPSQPPQFLYENSASIAMAEERILELRKDLHLTDLPDNAQRFLKWRLAETELLLLFLQAHADPDKVTETDTQAYRAKQQELYGALDKKLFYGVLGFIETIAARHKTRQQYVDELHQLIGNVKTAELPVPRPATFEHYRQLFRQALPKLYGLLRQINGRRVYEPEEITRLFDGALACVGAQQAGWHIVHANKGSNIIVSKNRKALILPRHMQTESGLRLRQMIAHEVGRHVLTDMHNHETVYEGSGTYEEGVAIMLEQLQAAKHGHKRTTRYLAICLAWGLDGRPRVFSEVYEILQRAFMILGHNATTANFRAFRESARAFRGGLPSAPGMVYLKDKVYLEGNIRVWKLLEQNMLSVREFKDLLEGRDTMLRERTRHA